jgi:parallel beta-helix repeat protein
VVSYTIISNNTVKNSNFGINTHGNYNYIFNNNVDDSDQCALDLQGNFSVFYQNIAKSSQRGIEIAGSNNNISSNVAFNNYRWGIRIGWVSDSRLTVNNTITKNNISDCKYGIFLTKSNNNFTENRMYGCGLYIETLESSIEELTSHYIDPTNLVNDKPLYYYVNKSELNQEDFINAGQVILVNCNDSNISNLNLINASVGLAMSYCQNNTISNNTIDQNSYYGIRLDYCDNNFILRNNGSNNYYGIYVRGNSNNISKNFLTNNEYCGICIYGNLTTVYDNYITGNQYGISLGGFYNNLSSNSMNLCGLRLTYFGLVISFNNIDKSNLVNGKPLYYYVDENNLGSADFLNGGQVILINCDNSIISDLDLSHGSGGISLYYCNNIEMLRNDVSYNGYYAISLTESHFNKIYENNASNNENGIWLYNSNNNTISRNIVRNNYREIGSLYTEGSGIFLMESSGNTIEKNYVANNQFGINLRGTRYNIVHENTVHNNHYIGILLKYSENCIILKNEVTYNANKTWWIFTSWGGIFLFASSINVIEENNVSNNYYNGLTLRSSYNNTIIKNLLKNNTEKGIEIPYDPMPGYNAIYYNAFLENGLNAEDNSSNNYWDNGINGNYWDDYTGLDTDDNGIGDVPYNITGSAGSQDNFPLMKNPFSTHQEGEGEVIPFELILLISVISGGAVIGVATILLIRSKRKKMQ